MVGELAIAESSNSLLVRDLDPGRLMVAARGELAVGAGQLRE